MRHLRASLLALFCILAFSSTAWSVQYDELFYISKSIVENSYEGDFAFIGNEWTPVEIYSDAGDFYLVAGRVATGPCYTCGKPTTDYVCIDSGCRSRQRRGK